MNFIKIIFLSSFLFILFNGALAQAVIQFEQTDYDFGQVAEGTQATHEFKFKNTGSAPLTILNVQASCGCTTPFWTKEPVKPGGEGVITASYNSKGRPGSFNKSITITSNASEPSKRVSIKGTVVPVSKVGIVFTEEELETSAKVSLEKSVVNLGKVEAGQAVPVEIIVQNTGKKNLVISDLKSACNCIKMAGESSSVIHPGAKGTLNLIYRPKSTGKKTDTATLFTNDLSAPESKVILQADVVENLNNTSILKENNTGFNF